MGVVATANVVWASVASVGVAVVVVPVAVRWRIEGPRAPSLRVLSFAGAFGDVAAGVEAVGMGVGAAGCVGAEGLAHSGDQ